MVGAGNLFISHRQAISGAVACEIGDLMAFLASDRSGYTSGVIYTVDGGISAGWG